MANRNDKQTAQGKPSEASDTNKDPHSTDRRVISTATLIDQIDEASQPHTDFVEAVQQRYTALVHGPDGQPTDLADLSLLPDVGEAFAFDWFEATAIAVSSLGCTTRQIEEEDAATRAILATLIAGGLSPVRDPGGAGKSYGVSLQLKSDLKHADAVAKVSFGSHTGAMPHITVTGADGQCHSIATHLQSARLPLKPTRIDVKVDISMKDLWSRLKKKADEQAGRSKKIKRPVVISGSEGGETFRLGAPSSSTCIRVYKKDFERFAKKKIKEEDIDPNLVRIEFQLRPKGLDAIAMGFMTPWQIAQSTPMSRAFLKALGEVLELPGDCEIIKGQSEVSARTEFDAEASGFHQYQGTFARAACALLFDEVAQELAATGQGEGRILPASVEELMIARFAAYVKDSKIAEKVLAEYGFSAGVAYDPEDRAEAIISLAHKLQLQRFNDRLLALAQTLDLFTDLGFSNEMLSSVSDKIDTMEEAVWSRQSEEPPSLESIKTVWGHIHPPELYLRGLDHYLASRGFRLAPALTEMEFECAHALECVEDQTNQ